MAIKDKKPKGGRPTDATKIGHKNLNYLNGTNKLIQKKNEKNGIKTPKNIKTHLRTEKVGELTAKPRGLEDINSVESYQSK